MDLEPGGGNPGNLPIEWNISFDLSQQAAASVSGQQPQVPALPLNDCCYQRAPISGVFQELRLSADVLQQLQQQQEYQIYKQQLAQQIEAYQQQQVQQQQIYQQQQVNHQLVDRQAAYNCLYKRQFKSPPYPLQKPHVSEACKQQVEALLYPAQQIQQQAQLIQGVQIVQKRKRGRPRKPRPGEQQGQFPIQYLSVTTTVPIFNVSSSTAPQQVYQIKTNAPSCSRYNNDYNSPPTSSPAQLSLLPTYGTSITNCIVEQENFKQPAAQRTGLESKTIVNTGGNANSSTQNFYEHNNLRYHQPSQESNLIASGAHITKATVDPLQNIEAVVRNVNAYVNNGYQHHITNSCRAPEINSVYVNLLNRCNNQPHVRSTSHASTRNVRPIDNTAAGPSCQYVLPLNNQNINPHAQTKLLSTYNSPSCKVPNVLINSAQQVVINVGGDQKHSKATPFKTCNSDINPSEFGNTAGGTRNLNSAATETDSGHVFQHNPIDVLDSPHARLNLISSEDEAGILETLECLGTTKDLVDSTPKAREEFLAFVDTCYDNEQLDNLMHTFVIEANCSSNYELNARHNRTNANISDPAPPGLSNNNLALVTENNDAQLLSYPRNVSNFGRTTLVAQHSRAPPAETSGVAIETEQFFNSCSAGERRSSCGASPAAVQPSSLPSSAVANFNATLPSAVSFISTSQHPNSLVPGGTNYSNAGGDEDEFSEQFLIKQTHLRTTKTNQEAYSQQQSPVLDNIEVNFADDILEVGAGSEPLTTSPYNIIAGNNAATEQQHIPTSDIASDMKYETQSGPPPAQSHMTSTGVEPPHSSQGPGMLVGSSPTDADGVTVMLPTWNGGAPDYLDPASIKQTNQGLSDTWDSLLIDQTLDVPQPQIAADRRPLPSFIGYTSHLSINGISGLHYHTIASSAQRSVIPSGSPTQSSNQEYYASVVPDTQEYQEPPVVSSSTPCQQGSQKQQQQQQPHTNNQHCNQHQHHHHNHHQQQLPQSTQQIDLDIEADIARLISNAIAADTTVSSGGSSGNDANSGNDGATGNGSNGGSSSLVQDQDASSRHTSPWNDIVDWFDTACTTNKHQETNVYTVYSTSSPVQTQQHGSNIPNLLTYSPLLQARLQAGNTETPSSTSTYPPVSPPGRVSTSGSPDQNLHSSYTAPSHSRKRSRGSQGTQNPAKKAAAAISYSNDASMAGGKEKPVHRCSICSRGFLNKSNIKVHLRTHTGEKPFKCTTCEKTFRQKAHLIKHQQIHKRGSRD